MSICNIFGGGESIYLQPPSSGISGIRPYVPYGRAPLLTPARPPDGLLYTLLIVGNTKDKHWTSAVHGIRGCERNKDKSLIAGKGNKWQPDILYFLIKACGISSS